MGAYTASVKDNPVMGDWGLCSPQQAPGAWGQQAGEKPPPQLKHFVIQKCK